MTDTRITRFLGLLVSTAVAGCGGSGDGDTFTQPPPPAAIAKTTVGQITGFGSIYVNGVEYNTAGAAYDVDDDVASGDDALAVGMIVNIQGSVDPNGRTGTANSVSYDDDVEGPVANLATDPDDMSIKTFEIMGVAVQADKNSTNFEAEDDPAFSFETIADGDNVEVSGEYSGDTLLASYIEKQDALDDDYEARGTVDQYDGADQFVLILRNGSTLNVEVAAGAEIPSAGIADGQYVEVEGRIPDPVNAPDTLLASKVELEDEDRIDSDDEDEVEIKGILAYDADTATWSVKGVQLAFGEATMYSPESLADRIADQSADGLFVEVEGQYLEGVLQVRELELEDDELEFKADVSSVTAVDARDGALGLTFGNAMGSVDVQVTPDTMFLDDDAMDHYDLSSIMVGDKVEIEARMGDDGLVYASNLHLEDDMGYEIKGPLDAIDEVSITVMGVEFTIDMDTFFEDGTPTVGDYVEVEDDDGDGIADAVEIDD